MIVCKDKTKIKQILMLKKDINKNIHCQVPLKYKLFDIIVPLYDCPHIQSSVFFITTTFSVMEH